MTSSNIERAFVGSIPQLYEQYLVPLIFEPYAEDLAARVAALKPGRVLELAAGTGVVTRKLAARLPADVSIVATDLNQPMLDQAAAKGTSRAVEWRQADAMQLPFAAESFDVVVCQFGAMFFPDKGRAFFEARRVLRPGGTFVFNVWDRIEENEFTDVVGRAVKAAFPESPPSFIERVPHGYYESEKIAQDLARGGFAQTPEFHVITRRSRADSPQIPAIAFCQGTPIRNEIEARDASRVEEITQDARRALLERFGPGPISGKIQAIVVSVRR